MRRNVKISKKLMTSYINRAEKSCYRLALNIAYTNSLLLVNNT